MKGGNINQFMNIGGKNKQNKTNIIFVASTWRNGCKRENSKWYVFQENK